VVAGGSDHKALFQILKSEHVELSSGSYSSLEITELAKCP
jgi:hypothetical protein